MAFVWRPVDFDVLEGPNRMWTMDDFDITSPVKWQPLVEVSNLQEPQHQHYQQSAGQPTVVDEWTPSYNRDTITADRMPYKKLLTTLLSSCRQTIDFLMDAGIMDRRKSCTTCGAEMNQVMSTSSKASSEGWEWCCRRTIQARRHQVYASVKKDSWLACWIFLSWWSSSTSDLLVWRKLKFNMSEGLPGTPRSIGFLFAGKSVRLIWWKSVSQSEDLALSARLARVSLGRGSTTGDTELKATGFLVAVKSLISRKCSSLLSRTGPEMSCYHSSRNGLNLARSSTLIVGSRMTHLGKRAILIWRLATAFSSSIQKLVPTPTTLRMSGGMLSKPNLHMVQSMPMCSHT